MNKINTSCPACGKTMEITRYQCTSCGTAIEGRFSGCEFCRLSTEQREFVKTFLSLRGNIKEVERELGMSYPTVRARLDAISEQFGARRETPAGDYNRILDQVERGELSATEALNLIKGR